MTEMTKNKKLISFILLAIGGGTIFKAMYLREVFYYPWNAYMGVNNMESGLLMSWLGTVGVFAGLVAGPITDRLNNTRLLLGFSYLVMAMACFAQSMQVGFISNFVIIGIMSFVGNGLFLVTMVRATRLLAGDDEQGKFFGSLESGRGIAGTLLTLMAVWLLSLKNNDPSAIGLILRFDGAVYCALGILSYMYIPKNQQRGACGVDGDDRINLSDMMSAIRIPELWLAAFSVACVIFVYQGSSYVVPYLNDAFGMTSSTSSFIGMIRAYCLAFVISPFVGLLADRVGSTLLVMKQLFALGFVAIVVMIFVPASSSYIALIVTVLLVIGSINFALRGIMYAQVNEIGIPKKITGTAMGILLFVGFSPEMFIHLLFGYWLDACGMRGYTYMFTCMAIVCILGCISSRSLYRRIHTATRIETINPA